jgi:hypothetical protein
MGARLNLNVGLSFCGFHLFLNGTECTWNGTSSVPVMGGICQTQNVGRTCKIAARNHEMKHKESKPTRIRTAEELKDFCEGKLTLPQRTVKQKNGKGIFKRYFHYVPAAGELKTVEAIKAERGVTSSGAVNRRIRKGKTIKGSSKFHVFADVGVVGHLICRERCCYSPDCACWDGKYKLCTQVPRDSNGLAQAGHPLLPQDRQIAADGSAEHMVPMTRNALSTRHSLGCWLGR